MIRARVVVVCLQQNQRQVKFAVRNQQSIYLVGVVEDWAGTASQTYIARGRPELTSMTTPLDGLRLSSGIGPSTSSPFGSLGGSRASSGNAASPCRCVAPSCSQPKAPFRRMSVHTGCRAPVDQSTKLKRELMLASRLLASCAQRSVVRGRSYTYLCEVGPIEARAAREGPALPCPAHCTYEVVASHSQCADMVGDDWWASMALELATFDPDSRPAVSNDADAAILLEVAVQHIDTVDRVVQK
eukprot:COSAG01_NODE_8453_length_2781_cov_1.537286_2_plen_243_part_00